MSEFWLNNPKAARQFFEPGQGSTWCTGYLGGWWLPGLVDATLSTSQKIDVVSAPGVEGGNFNYGGSLPADVSLKVLTWTKAQYDELAPILARLDPRKSKRRPPPLQVRHPKLALAGVLELVIKKIDWFADGPFAQSKVTTFDCVQWMKPKPIYPAGTLRLPTAATTESSGSPAASPGKSQP